jgi:arginyl-tRNA synthetase
MSLMTRAKLTELIQQTVQKLYDVEVHPVVQYAEPGFGDFSTGVAFQLAKPTGKNPRDVAAELAAAIKDDDIAGAEPAGAGYVNITLTESVWQESLKEVESGYARGQSGKDRKAQVEFISANPTGPLTLANARGGFVGDAVANLLTAAGYEVTREYYVNDAGGQVAKLAESLKAEAGLPIAGERQYSGEYLKDLLAKVDPRQVGADEIGPLAVAVCLEWIKQAAARLGIGFDEWFSERSLIEGGQTEAMLSWLREHSLTYEKDGAVWLASTKIGDERDRVLVRSSGEPTYLLGDLAYHYDIFISRGFELAVKVWGADHAGQVASLQLSVQQIKQKARLDFVLLQFVRLMQAGKEVKMSKRAGTYVTIDELLDTLEQAVGKTYADGVARWFFLNRSADTRVDFDLELARDTSQKNPYFYVMYAYARANSILRKAEEKGLTPGSHSGLLAGIEIEMTKYMARLPELTAELAENYEVHRLTYFAQAAATLFQNWYESGRIIDLPSEEAAAKLYFVQRYIYFMEELFGLIGLDPVKQMID